MVYKLHWDTLGVIFLFHFVPVAALTKRMNCHGFTTSEKVRSDIYSLIQCLWWQLHDIIMFIIEYVIVRQDLTSLPSQTISSRWQMDMEAIGLSRVQQFSHLCVACPYQISVNSIFKHIHTTSINTIIWQFVPLIFHPLWERVLSHVQPTLLLN